MAALIPVRAVRFDNNMIISLYNMSVDIMLNALEKKSRVHVQRDLGVGLDMASVGRQGILLGLSDI